jgi:hypothetical protein
MLSGMDSEYCQEQIDLIKAQIVAYQLVLTQIANPHRSYMFDTGQTKEQILKQDPIKIRDLINGLMGDLQGWYDCLNNTGTSILGPAF